MCRQGRKPLVSPKALAAAREFLIAMVGEEGLQEGTKYVAVISLKGGQPTGVEFESRAKYGRGHRIKGDDNITDGDWVAIMELVWSERFRTLLELCKGQENMLKATQFQERDRKGIDRVLILAGMPYRLCTKKGEGGPAEWPTRIVRCEK